MTAPGIVICALFWGLSMACVGALIVMYLAARNERRELISRLYGNPPPETKEPPMPKSYITAHERAIKKWRHKDEDLQE